MKGVVRFTYVLPDGKLPNRPARWSAAVRCLAARRCDEREYVEKGEVQPQSGGGGGGGGDSDAYSVASRSSSDDADGGGD